MLINTIFKTKDYSKQKNSQNPACACGRVGLYDEWIKQNEKEENSSISVKSDQLVSPSDALKGLEPEQKQTLK